VTGVEPRWWRARLRAVVVVTGGFVLAVIALGALSPGYRPAAETVSRLGSANQPDAWAARGLFVLYGATVMAACPVLGRSVCRWPGQLAGLLAVYATAGLVAGLAPKDADGVPGTAASQVHVAATIVGGAALVLAMVQVARWGWHRLDRAVAVAAAVGVMVAAVVFRQTWGSSYYGIVERMLLGVALAWVVWLCVRLLRCPPGALDPPSGASGRR
jgi:hypothetical protein